MPGLNYIFQVSVIILITLFMVIEPRVSVEAARRGLLLWAQVVVPALLPFFIVSDLLVRLQVMHYLGHWLDPLMKPLFNLPGAAGLAVAMGYTSGFPVGAIVSTRLLKEQILTREQATRLIAFTNNSSPLFIVGAIGVGMLGSAEYGYLLAAAHYLSNLTVGWYLGRKSRVLTPASHTTFSSPGLIPPLGVTLSESIRQSITNICQIGGFIVFFMVLTACLATTGLLDLISRSWRLLLPQLTPGLSNALTLGLMEITMGSQAICAADGAVLWRLMVLSGVLSFSGLCILAQISSIMAEQRLAFAYYIRARCLQIPPALVFTWIGWHLLSARPVSTHLVSNLATRPHLDFYLAWLAILVVLVILGRFIGFVASWFGG